jgi:hypothetical protein
MPECSMIPNCPFFQGDVPGLPRISDYLISTYCMGDYRFCARHIALAELGPDGVPQDILPHETNRIKKMF